MSDQWLKPVFAALALAFVTHFAGAAEVEGVKVPDRVTVGDTGPEVVLNGAGLRTRAFFRVYVGALYLQQKKTAADAVLADTGAKRIALHLLRDLTSEQLLSAFNDGLKSNHAPAELAKLDAQVKQLEGIFAAVKEAKSGEVILLDYVPGSGTRVVVNRDTKGTIPGEDFNRALLRIWLGERPVDAALKKAMLGG
jgi:hypothetical protein